jgi:hypothetical protein
MAVGDVVNGLATDGNTITFTPAAGVECILTSVLGRAAGAYLTDGVSIGYIGNLGNADAFMEPQDRVVKVFINNTNYYYSTASPAGNNSGYTGLQIK